MSAIKPGSIRTTLMAAIVIITIVPATIISLYYYRNIANEIQVKMVDSTYSGIVLLAGNIDKQLNSVKQLSHIISFNQSVKNLTEGDYTRPSALNSIQQAERDIFEYAINMQLNPYISFVTVTGGNGFQMITAYKSSYSLGIAENLIRREAEERRDGVPHDKIRIVQDGYAYGPVLAYEQPLIHSSRNETTGFVKIYLSRKFFTDIFSDYIIEDENYYFIVNGKGEPVFHRRGEEAGRDPVLNDRRYLDAILEHNNGYFTANIGGENRLVVFERLKSTDWKLAQVVSMDPIVGKQREVIRQLIVIVSVSCVVFIALFLFYFSKHLMTPLRKLLAQINRISGGELVYESSTLADNELGIIERGLNRMSLRLKEYMEEEARQQELRRNLEFKVLQSQINPHFIYNTLNSIRWMAEIRNAEGVKRMVKALGDLIRNISLVPTEKTVIRSEIPLIEDYVYIQNIRYKGKINLTFDIADERLLDACLLKFTLQPIVENAIFHGIEPKKGIGRIRIAMRAENGELHIMVEDDGVGIPADKLKRVLADRPDEPKIRGMGGIALKNIDERLKLVYGERYGLGIESEAGSGTRVHIRVPLEMSAGSDAGEGGASDENPDRG